MQKIVLFICFWTAFFNAYCQEIQLQYAFADSFESFYRLEMRAPSFHLLQHTKFQLKSNEQGRFQMQAETETLKGIGADLGVLTTDFQLDRLGELLYKQEQEIPASAQDLGYFFPIFPDRRIQKATSWEHTRKVKDVGFDSLRASYTVEKIDTAYILLAVELKFIGTEARFRKTMSGQYAVDKQNGQLLAAFLHVEAFTGFREQEMDIFINKRDPDVPEPTMAEQLKANAKSFVKDCFGNRLSIQCKQVFIMDEANEDTHETYMRLAREGYLEMELEDTSICCRTYQLTLLPKIETFLDQHSSPVEGECGTVITHTYDSIHIVKIKSFEGYFEIVYQVHHVQPTPFGPLNRLRPSAIKGENFEASCFVRQINGSWQLDKDNQFRGFPDENGKY